MLLKILTTIGVLSFAAPALPTTIPIPNPPQSRSVPTQTRQQCYQQIHNMRIARNRAGWDRESSARLWAKHVDQCKRIPAAATIEVRRGRSA